MIDLSAVGRLEDSKIDLAGTALALAVPRHPGSSPDRYGHHLDKTGQDVRARCRVLTDSGAPDNPETRLAALKYVLDEREGYGGDEEIYDDPQNADLMCVIDRRKGLPIALGILYIHAARAAGWAIQGLNFPGQFILRLDGADGQRLIFDPSDHCRVLQAADLRRMVKDAMGGAAELSASYYEPASNREILIRLQNNIKLRQIESEDYEGALRTVEAMRLVDPVEFRLLLDEGVLCARTGRRDRAIAALEAYMKKNPDERSRREVALMVQHLKGGR